MTKPAAITTAHLLCRLPPTLPGREQLMQTGRALLNPGDRVVIETPREVADFSLSYADRFYRMDGPWTADRAVLLTAEGTHPEELAEKVRCHVGFAVHPRMSSVPRSAVEGFVDDVAKRAASYTRGAVDAQLLLWDIEGLKHLQHCRRSSAASADYVEYLIRRANHLMAVPFAREIDRRILRFASSPMEDGAAVSRDGWPVRGDFPPSSHSTRMSPATTRYGGRQSMRSTQKRRGRSGPDWTTF